MPIQHVSREKQLFKRTGFNSILTALCCCNFPLSTGTAAPSSLSPGNEQHQNLKGWCKPSLCGTKVTWYTFCAAAQRLRPNLIGEKKKKKRLGSIWTSVPQEAKEALQETEGWKNWAKGNGHQPIKGPSAMGSWLHLGTFHWADSRIHGNE